MTKKISKKKIEQRKIFILKCLIVLMTISSIIFLYCAFQYDFGEIANKKFWEKKCAIYLIIDWIIIIIYFWIGHSVKNLKKKLK